jgi:hypothetical protein
LTLPSLPSRIIAIPSHDNWRHATPALALALGFLSPNGCLQQIAANRFSTPQDVIAILLQGFVRHALFPFISTRPRERGHTVGGRLFHSC